VSDVIIRPEDVRQFSNSLSSLGNRLQSEMARARGQLNALGETYRDQSYQHFVNEFGNAQQNIERFRQEVDRFVNFLNRKATTAEAVRQVRL